MKFRTKSGSIYIIDDDSKLVQRVVTTSISGPIRGGDAPIHFNSRSDVVVGQGVHFWCDPIDPKADVRDIYTADVTEIL